MYAIFRSGGKQHRVAQDDVVRLEKLDAAEGDKVEFDEILLIHDGKKMVLGSPYVAKAKVVAEVVANGRADKIKIVKFHRRKHHKKQMGHRQSYTEVKIVEISVKKAAAKKKEKVVEASGE